MVKSHRGLSGPLFILSLPFNILCVLACTLSHIHTHKHSRSLKHTSETEWRYLSLPVKFSECFGWNCGIALAFRFYCCLSEIYEVSDFVIVLEGRSPSTWDRLVGWWSDSRGLSKSNGPICVITRSGIFFGHFEFAGKTFQNEANYQRWWVILSVGCAVPLTWRENIARKFFMRTLPVIVLSSHNLNFFFAFLENGK